MYFLFVGNKLDEDINSKYSEVSFILVVYTAFPFTKLVQCHRAWPCMLSPLFSTGTSDSLHPDQPPENYTVGAVLLAKCMLVRKSSLLNIPISFKKRPKNFILCHAFGTWLQLGNLSPIHSTQLYWVTRVWKIEPGCTLDAPRHPLWTSHWSPKVYVITIWAKMQALHIKRDCFLARPTRSITISKWRGILLTMMEEACREHSAIMFSHVKAWHFFPSLPAVMLLGWSSSGLCNGQSLSEPTVSLVSVSWSHWVYITPVLWSYCILKTVCKSLREWCVAVTRSNKPFLWWFDANSVVVSQSPSGVSLLYNGYLLNFRCQWTSITGPIYGSQIDP